MKKRDRRHLRVKNASDALRTEQVRSTYCSLPLTLGAVVVNASLLVFVLTPVISYPALLAWYAASLLLTSVRFGSWLVYRRQSSGNISPPIWSAVGAAGALLSGVFWAAIPWLVPPLHEAHLLFVALVVAGMCAGA